MVTFASQRKMIALKSKRRYLTLILMLVTKILNAIILVLARMSDRIKSFKNKSWVDADDARRRRKEGAVELRKVTFIGYIRKSQNISCFTSSLIVRII